jgi:ubiquinone/menaquinone biosynthesis C-methylase UbiE
MSSVSYRHFTGTAAEHYDRFFVPAIAQPVSGDVLRAADVQPGERVLDVACGTGVVARLAAAQVGPRGSVTGVDVAADMIAVASAGPVAGGPPVDWHVADATSLPFPEAEYDLVVCQLGLMFMDDAPAALAEMHRVLAPGGRLVVSTPGRIQRPFEIMEQAIAQHIGAELGGFVRLVFSMHDPEAVAALLHDAGLRDVMATVTTAALTLPGPAEFLWQYINLTPMGPIVAAAPEPARAAMERQVVEGWAPFVVNGVTPVSQPMVLATARR